MFTNRFNNLKLRIPIHIYSSSLGRNIIKFMSKTNFKFARHIKKEIIKHSAILGRYPLNVQIQTVSTCNGKCQFCPYQGSWQNKNPGKMSWDIYERIIQDLKDYKIGRFLPYLENEPLSDIDLFDKIEYAVKFLDFDILEISTNLALLNADMVKRIKEIFPRIPHEIGISFHGASRESYEKVMGLNYDKVMKNIMILVDIMQELPLNIVIRGAGVSKYRSDEYETWFHKEDYLYFWEKQLSSFKKKPCIYYFHYHDRAGSPQLTSRRLNFNFRRNDQSNFYCIRFDRWVHFLYTGEPILCCMDYNRETVFDHKIGEKTIGELYHSTFFIDLIKCGIGIKQSKENFICKRCVSPGG